MATVEEAKELICELCRTLYGQGHVSGTGGGISIKVQGGLPGSADAIVMAPSGVQKERMQPSDMFVLDASGEVVAPPTPRPPSAKPPKLSECAPLFMSAYDLRGAGAVIHGHSINALLATLLDPHATEFHITHVEMIKGITGHGFYSDCVVPIIENTARECELTDRLRQVGWRKDARAGARACNGLSVVWTGCWTAHDGSQNLFVTSSSTCPPPIAFRPWLTTRRPMRCSCARMAYMCGVTTGERHAVPRWHTAVHCS